MALVQSELRREKKTNEGDFAEATEIAKGLHFMLTMSNGMFVGRSSTIIEYMRKIGKIESVSSFKETIE